MIRKDELRLGQRVWYGPERESAVEAVVDGLTSTVCGLRLVEDGRYVICEYEEVWGDGV